MFDEILEQATLKMVKAVENVEHDLKSLRTGRASADMVASVKISAYGNESALSAVATVSTPDATTISIQPWDPTLLAVMEKALLAANLGMTPSNDGKVIRLFVPALTEETRKEMVKKAHRIAEQGRVAVRNVRRHANDEVKKTEKEHDISEDELKRHLEAIQKKTDENIKKVEDLTAKKESEIMTI
ncbi:ribosome recycling factor [Candidatus Sumerlaeota bacterium]|nr:ribosome recycling factor [Candidatus Sumerlaeota bacterium]